MTTPMAEGAVVRKDTVAVEEKEVTATKAAMVVRKKEDTIVKKEDTVAKKEAKGTVTNVVTAEGGTIAHRYPNTSHPPAVPYCPPTYDPC